MGDNVVCKELEATTTQDLEDDRFLEQNGYGFLVGVVLMCNALVFAQLTSVGPE